ncbi:hypothetical protein D3C87_233710 [compost metagenome]
MKEIIKRSQIRLNTEKKQLKSELIQYLTNCSYHKDSRDIQIIDLKYITDLDKVYAGSGFYIILCNKDIDQNLCSLVIDKYKAIYRGHSFFTRKRLKSHLFNTAYKAERKDNEPNYKVCLKFEDKTEGINIDSEPYSAMYWKVIIHKMNKSNQLIREQMELAFDEVYGRPIKSREIINYQKT